MNDPSIDILTQRLAEADIDPQMRDALISVVALDFVRPGAYPLS